MSSQIVRFFLEDWMELMKEAVQHYKERLSAFMKDEETIALNLSDTEFADLNDQLQYISEFEKNSHQFRELGPDTADIWRIIFGSAIRQYKHDLEALKTLFQRKVPKSEIRFKKLDEKIQKLDKVLDQPFFKRNTEE